MAEDVLVQRMHMFLDVSQRQGWSLQALPAAQVHSGGNINNNDEGASVLRALVVRCLDQFRPSLKKVDLNWVAADSTLVLAGAAAGGGGVFPELQELTADYADDAELERLARACPRLAVFHFNALGRKSPHLAFTPRGMTRFAAAARFLARYELDAAFLKELGMNRGHLATLFACASANDAPSPWQRPRQPLPQPPPPKNYLPGGLFVRKPAGGVPSYVNRPADLDDIRILDSLCITSSRDDDNDYFLDDEVIGAIRLDVYRLELCGSRWVTDMSMIPFFRHAESLQHVHLKNFSAITNPTLTRMSIYCPHLAHLCLERCDKICIKDCGELAQLILRLPKLAYLAFTSPNPPKKSKRYDPHRSLLGRDPQAILRTLLSQRCGCGDRVTHVAVHYRHPNRNIITYELHLTPTSNHRFPHYY